MGRARVLEVTSHTGIGPNELSGVASEDIRVLIKTPELHGCGDRPGFTQTTSA